jgi:hypothetical protein
MKQESSVFVGHTAMNIMASHSTPQYASGLFGYHPTCPARCFPFASDKFIYPDERLRVTAAKALPLPRA